MIDAADMTPEYIRLADGKFDSRNRYIRRVASGATMSMVNGPTVSGYLATEVRVGWRWQIGSATFASSSYAPDGFNSATEVAV